MAESTMRQHMNERFNKADNFIENPPLPKSLNIELNSSCNQSCIFCSFHGKYAIQHPKPAVINYETAVEILKQAKKLGIGEKEVGFYLSGEAFLHKDLAQIVKCAKDLGFQYTFLTTNGALATKENLRRVLDAGLDSIRFSINAADRETYKQIHGKDDFNVVVENLEFMREYLDQKKLNVATSISCVITKKTKPQIEKFKKEFSKYVDDILFIPVMLNRLNCDDMFIQEYSVIDDSNARINEQFVCPMLFNTMYIGADLKVMPCCEAYDDECFFYDLRKDFSLENAWNSESYRRYRNIFLKKESDVGTICEKCMLRMKGIERLILD